jgi:RNA polymerase sigma factor (sigma-70 family)
MDMSRQESTPAPDTVIAAQHGDGPALDQLLSFSLPLVYNIVGHGLRGHSDTDDLVQETMLRIVRGLPQLRDPAAFRSWVVAVAIRQVRWHRADLARAPRIAALAQVPEPADPQADFVDLCILRLGLTGQRREVAEATRWLDEADQELLALWWLEAAGSLGRGELAAALDLTSPHAAVRIQRMKQQLDIARAVVRALSLEPRCADLALLIGSWNHNPNPLWRKRLGRHLRGCAECGNCARDLVPADGLLVGLGLVPAMIPISGGLYHAAGQAAGQGAGQSAGQSVGQAAGQAGARHANPASGHGAGAGSARHGGAVRHGRFLRYGKVTTLGKVLGATGAILAAGSVSALALTGTHTVAPQTQTLALATGLPTTVAPVVTTTVAPTPTPTPAVTTTPPTTAPAKPPVVVSTPVKKGAAAWNFSGIQTALAASGVSWYYNWGTNPSGITAPSNVQFVPMIWGPGSVTAANLAQVKQEGDTLLGFNEPDMTSQSNMTPAQALDLWPQLMATGMALGSPAVAANAATPGDWLDQFMQGAQSKGYRVNFITVHWYGSDFVTADAVSQLESYLAAVHARYGLPIWLTEYALINFSGGTSYPSTQQQVDFVTASTNMLQSLSYVDRYSWFAFPDTTPGQTGMFQPGGAPDPLGSAYEAAG